MNSDHAPAEMQVTHECYVASLIFLRGHIQENELLPGFHPCGQGDKSGAEIQHTDVGFLVKRLFVNSASIHQSRVIWWQNRHCDCIAQDLNLFPNHGTIKAIIAVFATKRACE